MNRPQSRPPSLWLFLAVALAGIAARLLAATCGHDCDMESWVIIAKLADHGENVYAHTDLYNFAPGWFYILHVLYVLAGHNPAIFRYLVSGFLGLGDAGICYILWRRFGKLAACWFIFNPISIIISGYQCNFDNLAIFLGLAAVWVMGDEFAGPLNRRKLWGLVILGISLVVKHVFFAFPFWLAVKQKGLRQKLAVILIPTSLFALSFVPYWHTGSQGIIKNVFLFRSFTTQFFYHMFLPQFVQFMFSSLTVWLLALTVFAFVCRKKNTMESLLLYTCVLVATAPADVNEYLAIPGAFVATHLNPLTILYTAAGTAHLLVALNGPLGSPPFAVRGFGAAYLAAAVKGLHLHSLFGLSFIDVAIYLLCLALAWVTWRQTIAGWFRQFWDWCVTELKVQLGSRE